MTPLMVITVLCAAVAEESDLREQGLSRVRRQPCEDENVRRIQAFIE